MDCDAHAFKLSDQFFNLIPGIIRKMKEDLIYDLNLQLLIEIGLSCDDGNILDSLMGSFLFLIKKSDAGHLKAPLWR